MAKKIKLTPKQKLFCEYYLGSSMFNATDAARRAGYSKKTAQVIGAQNLLKVIVKEYIEKRKAELFEEIKNEHFGVIKSMRTLAQFNINQLYDDNGNLKKISDLPEDVAYAITSIETIRRKDGEEFDTIDKLKTVDKTKMLETLAKIKIPQASKPATTANSQ